MKNLSPINENKDVVTKEYVDPIKSQAALNRTTLGTQCKNLLKHTAVSKTVRGITFTVNNDNSVTVNGTNDGTNVSTFVIASYTDLPILQKNIGKSVILSGCPANFNSIGRLQMYSPVSGETKYDRGSSVTFTVTKECAESTYNFAIIINSGATVNNVTFYPMLRYADITDDTYEPYKESVDERLIENKSNIAINKSTLGYTRKNLLKNTAETKTINNVTFTVNSDSSITATQTTTNPDNAVIDVATNITLSPGTYILTGDDEIRLSGFGAIRFYINGTIYSSNTVHKFDTEVTISRVTIFIWKGVNIKGSKTIYPMLRYADILDGTYEPYQPSVQEQTPYSISVSGKSTSAAISYSGVPTLICLTPNTADSTAGGLYMINSAGAVVKLIEKTGVVVAADTASNTFTITNNTSTVMDVCISRCWGR